ncbi:MAG: sulfatase [Flavobacteriales bacterium]|nr:sulfatase [Flavobacteriales bacterium]
MRIGLIHFGLLIILGSVVSCTQQEPKTEIEIEIEAKPNVVVIYVDDMGWTDLACFGSDFYETPNIDALAADGVKFTNSYSSCTVCSPSRASFMTGKYPARLHLTDWIQGHKYPYAKMKVPEWDMQLDSSEFSIAEAFQEAGYFTAHIGKWHLGDEEKDWPEHHGFDVNIGGWAKGAPQNNKEKGYTGYFSPYGNPRLEDGPEGEYLTERLTNNVCDLIKEKANEPFFINFWLYSVHQRLQATEEKLAKYTAMVDSSKNHHNPIYAAMVEHVDDAVGKVVKQLKEQGLYENTIILFSSDNGGLHRELPKIVTSNAPLRSGKGDMYEGGVRVPTILYAPNHNMKTKEIHEPVITPDYYPTLLELAGISVQEKQKANMDGESWVPLLNDKSDFDREAIYWHYPHYHAVGAVPYSAIRLGDWKLVENLESGKIELFNLAKDISESTNLAEEDPKTATQLKHYLNQWRESVNAQFPTVNANYDKARDRERK